MKTLKLRKLLQEYINYADEKKIKALFTLVKDDIVYQNHWKDDAFVKEMEKRVEDYESGKSKGKDWETVKSNLG
ncbi:MAG TPA: addiction module protein [Flavobacteriaceae bacterium]|nr:addiction module protein [Flavobacteriaceae bacterium]